MRSSRRIYRSAYKFYEGLITQLVEYAKWILYANGTGKGSTGSRLAHWKQVEKTTGKAPQSLLNRPTFPDELSDLWTTYNQLVGKDELTYTEIDAYIRVMQIPITPWEIKVMFKLEAVRNG